MKSAPVFLVFFADMDQFGRRYGKTHADTMPLQDATIAMTFAHLAATEVGLGSCWIGTFARDKAKDICGLKGNLQFAGILILGKTGARKPGRTRRGPEAWAHKI
jgi:nitroreductase